MSIVYGLKFGILSNSDNTVKMTHFIIVIYVNVANNLDSNRSCERFAGRVFYTMCLYKTRQQHT